MNFLLYINNVIIYIKVFTYLYINFIYFILNFKNLFLSNVRLIFA